MPGWASFQLPTIKGAERKHLTNVLGNLKVELVDLSLPIFEGMPFYPGDISTKVSTRAMEPGWTVSSVGMSCHGATHVECAAHATKGGRTLDSFPLAAFVGEAQCIKREEVGKVVVDKEVLLIYTGYDKFWPQAEYSQEGLGLSLQEAEWLAGQKLKAVGNDTISIGSLDVHRVIFNSGSLIIESLCNLGMVLGKRFRMCFLPLKLSVESSPTRAVALLG
jgi:kynurenine formamidase